MDVPWKHKCLESAEPRLEELSPVHLAFRKSAEGANWTDSFEFSSGIKVKDTSLTAADLASQMYHERLLQKAVRA